MYVHKIPIDFCCSYNKHTYTIHIYIYIYRLTGGSVVKTRWSRKTPWRRAWQPTPVFLPRESHEQSSLVGFRPQGLRVGHD